VKQNISLDLEQTRAKNAKCHHHLQIALGALEKRQDHFGAAQK
jgi:hypothetical protein